MVSKRKNSEWYIGHDGNIKSLLWLSGNCKDKKGALSDFQHGSADIMVTVPRVIACGHNLANVS